MASYGKVVCALVVVLAFIQVGDALRCWSCSSEMDQPCADHFNVTNFNRYYNQFDSRNPLPQLMDCEQNHAAFPINQRSVCMKKKQTTYGRTTYIRQCRFLHYEERIGKCPSETTSSATTIDFCEYCDFDGCNTASQSAQSVFLALLPTALVAYIIKQ